MKHKRSTDAIVALAKKKREETAQKVEQAIRKMIKENGRINFNTVSCSAGVSKSYLYNHSDLRERIQALRKQQQQAASPKSAKRKMSDENKDAMIQLLRDRVKELEYENRRLKDENRRLHGKLYEQI
ncbi:TPA: transposase [Bacillus toyonensis]|nr:transposase [Bacillus toyonensis]